MEQMPPKHDVIELLAGVDKGLSEQEIDEIQRVALDRCDFFNRSIPDLRLEEWPE